MRKRTGEATQKAEGVVSTVTTTANAPAGQVRLLKAKEVTTILGLGKSKVYEMMERGELPVVHIGTAVRVPSNALASWIEEHTEKAA